VPEFIETLPRLQGTRLAYNHELNAKLIYKLCAALIRAGVARAEDWKRCGEDAITFAKESVLQAIGVECVKLLERNVDFYLVIRDVYPEGYGYGGKQQLSHDALAVSIFLRRSRVVSSRKTHRFVGTRSERAWSGILLDAYSKS